MKILFALMALVITNAWSQQEITRIQKYGICSGYHKFWWSYKHGAQQYNDSDFSKEVWQGLDNKFKGNGQYNEASVRTLKVINQAIERKDFIIVKQFAGFCHNLGLPIGQDTRQ
jgi:hypothetical protein